MIFRKTFVDVARIYYRKYREEISFVPMYVAPALRSVYLGRPVRFDPSALMEEERSRICGYLMEEITAMARRLPYHTVVPYPNIPKKDYPSSRDIKKGV